MNRRPLHPLAVLVLGLVVGVAVLGRAHAAPAHKPAASPTPASVSYEGTFLKTLARAPEAPSDWHPLQDKYGRFAIAVPSDWTEGTAPEDQPGLLYALVAGESQPPHDGFSANLVISQTQAPANFVMKADMVKKIADKMATEMKAYKYVVKDKAFTRVDGIPCVIIGGTMDVEGRQLRNLQLRLVHRGMNYLVTFTALDKYYTQYEPLFARLTKTLVFERETPSGAPSGSPSPSHT